jgi:hypothetical protein
MLRLQDDEISRQKDSPKEEEAPKRNKEKWRLLEWNQELARGNWGRLGR